METRHGEGYAREQLAAPAHPRLSHSARRASGEPERSPKTVGAFGDRWWGWIGSVITGCLALCPTDLSAGDLLHLRSGEVLRGAVRHGQSSEAKVVFKMVIEGPRGRGEAIREVSPDEIDFIEFSLTEEERSLAEGLQQNDVDDGSGEGAEGPEVWRRSWHRWARWLPFPQSPAGDFGLGLAESLLRERTETAAREALEVLARVIEGDWDSVRKARARILHLRAHGLAGQPQAAREEAERICQEDHGPEALVEAHLILGEAAFADLKALEETHPRWADEKELGRKWRTLYHQALDHFLFGSLFHGSLSEPSARGLWAAAQLYHHAGDHPRAQRAATDVSVLYPDTAPAEAARRLRQTYASPSENPPSPP